jgi:hypothetical protein
MNNKNFFALCAVTACVASLIPAATVQASSSGEARVGAVLQVPFGLDGGGFDIANLRLGAVCQLAEVEDDSATDDGDRAYGAELGVYVEPLGGWNVSGELLGFYGTTDIQGAVGMGYDMADGIFANVKLMAPYSEIGVRFLGPLEVYGGLRTLGDFDPDNYQAPIEVGGGEGGEEGQTYN